MSGQGFTDEDINITCRAYTDGVRTNRPLAPPLIRATTFEAEGAEQHRQLWKSGADAFYQRFAHPTTEFVAHRIAQLERAQAALLFSSGMGAISTSLFAMLSPGDELVAHNRIFAQTTDFITGPLGRMGIKHRFVDARDPALVFEALTDRTRVIYLETPSNPWLDLQDIGVIARYAADRGIAVMVDSTFASPVLQKPLVLGATLALHSATKYLGGHSDVMAGVVSGSLEHIQRIREWQVLMGSVLAPDAAWLLFRGMRTLALRVSRQAESAAVIATALASHPGVLRMHYPGFGQSAVPAGQMLSGGGVVSFELRSSEAARQFLDGLREIPVATSLGGVETVVELPLDLDFEPEASREDDRGLVRLSVGLESPDQLLSDILGALDGIRE